MRRDGSYAERGGLTGFEPGASVDSDENCDGRTATGGGEILRFGGWIFFRFGVIPPRSPRGTGYPLCSFGPRGFGLFCQRTTYAHFEFGCFAYASSAW